MKKILTKLTRNEKGQAMPLVLILMLVGGLILGPLLGFMSTGLKAGQVYEKQMYGLYAADAGVEDALWKIMNVPPASYPYPDPLIVNGMSVSVLIEERTTFYGEEVGEGPHPNYFEVASELIDYYEKEGSPGVFIYGYQLTLTNKTGQPVNLDRIIISCSIELVYSGGLYTNQADLDEGRLAPPPKNDFESGMLDDRESGGARILTWMFPEPYPQIAAAPDPENESYTTVTTTFELEGPEGLGISTFLMRTYREDIGTVWEFKPYKITAQADDGSTVVTTVTARALHGGGTVLVTYWEIE